MLTTTKLFVHSFIILSFNLVYFDKFPTALQNSATNLYLRKSYKYLQSTAWSEKNTF